MNKIETVITKSDRIDARRKSPAKLAEKILDRLKNAAPYGTNFVYDIPQDVREQVEAQMKHKFEIWANSWVAPLCRQIISKSEQETKSIFD